MGTTGLVIITFVNRYYFPLKTEFDFNFVDIPEMSLLDYDLLLCFIGLSFKLSFDIGTSFW